MNDKPTLTSLICFVLLLVLPLISPPLGFVLGLIFLLPVGIFVVYAPMAFIFYLVWSLYNYTMAFYLNTMSELKTELKIEPTDTEYQPTINYGADGMVKPAKYLGLLVTSSVPMYVYYALIALYIGEDVASPFEAFDFLLGAFDSDYD